MINDILIKKLVSFSYRDEFILHTSGEMQKKITELRMFHELGKKKLHLEPLQECFQLATVPFCQLLSHLQLFPQSIMKHCNLFMGYSGCSCENV